MESEITVSPSPSTEAAAQGDGPFSSETSPGQMAVLVVGVVAAVVSAATVAYFFWRRSHDLTPRVRSVQSLLDRCHAQVDQIQSKLDSLASSLESSKPADA